MRKFCINFRLYATEVDTTELLSLNSPLSYVSLSLYLSLSLSLPLYLSLSLSLSLAVNVS